MAIDACVDVVGARKSSSDTVALAGIDLHAGAGRVLALLGANGAGKTTLFDIVRDPVPVRSGTGSAGQRLLRATSCTRGMRNRKFGRATRPATLSRSVVFTHSRRPRDRRERPLPQDLTSKPLRPC